MSAKLRKAGFFLASWAATMTAWGPPMVARAEEAGKTPQHTRQVLAYLHRLYDKSRQ